MADQLGVINSYSDIIIRKNLFSFVKYAYSKLLMLKKIARNKNILDLKQEYESKIKIGLKRII